MVLTSRKSSVTCKKTVLTDLWNLRLHGSLTSQIGFIESGHSGPKNDDVWH